MQQGRELVPVLEAGLDERLIERVLAAAAEAPSEERVRAGVEAVVDAAVLDPAGVREALGLLRANPAALRRLEDGLGLPPRRATLALGAAIQLARAELAGPEPDLGGRAAELLRWLEGAF